MANNPAPGSRRREGLRFIYDLSVDHSESLSTQNPTPRPHHLLGHVGLATRPGRDGGPTRQDGSQGQHQEHGDEPHGRAYHPSLTPHHQP